MPIGAWTPQQIDALRALPHETEWLEFKVDNTNPEQMGQYISALANTAALLSKPHGIVVWGIEDETHEVVGTSFRPSQAKHKGQELENWLLQKLNPRPNIRFHEVDMLSGKVVVLEVPSASSRPIAFDGQEYIRVGSYKKRLADHPEKERVLWRVFETTPFEDLLAASGLDDSSVLTRIDYPIYFELLDVPLPENRHEIFSALQADRVLRREPHGTWGVTNLGALLLAKDLADFPGLSRKRLRIIQYRGRGRMEGIQEREFPGGYAAIFGPALEYLLGVLPKNEVLGDALRKSVPMFPPLAVRELLANALIHQDFTVKGSGPMVEVFEDRIEISNPGQPLIETERFVDKPPRSRNEVLAGLMRRFGICEERGSGIDKVVFQVELHQLPAPLFHAEADSTRAVLFAYKELNDMDRDDRIRACYLHACLKRVQHDFLTNSSLRQRFAIADHNKAQASRLIREAVEEGAIQPYDPAAGRKLMKYVPFWAAPKEVRNDAPY